jgi:hypothetical protein
MAPEMSVYRTMVGTVLCCPPVVHAVPPELGTSLSDWVRRSGVAVAIIGTAGGYASAATFVDGLRPALVAVGVVTAIGVAAVNRFRGTVANGGQAADTTVRIPTECSTGSSQAEADARRRAGRRVRGPAAGCLREACRPRGGAAGARRCPGSGRLTGPPTARTPPPTPPLPASPTRPGCRPPTSRSPSSTCSATKTSPTPCASARSAYPSSSTFTPEPRTNSISSPSTPPPPGAPSPTAFFRAPDAPVPHRWLPCSQPW